MRKFFVLSISVLAILSFTVNNSNGQQCTEEHCVLKAVSDPAPDIFANYISGTEKLYAALDIFYDDIVKNNKSIDSNTMKIVCSTGGLDDTQCGSLISDLQGKTFNSPIDDDDDDDDDDSYSFDDDEQSDADI